MGVLRYWPAQKSHLERIAPFNLLQDHSLFSQIASLGRHFSTTQLNSNALDLDLNLACLPIAMIGPCNELELFAAHIARNLDGIGRQSIRGLDLSLARSFCRQGLFRDPVSRFAKPGDTEAFTPVKSIVELLDGAGALIVAGGAYDYEVLARAIGPILDRSLTIILAGCPFMASIELGRHLDALRPDLILDVIEMDYPFDRRQVNLAGRTRNELRRSMQAACSISQGLMPASSVIERGLSDLKSILMPVFLVDMLFRDSVSVDADMVDLVLRLQAEISRLSQIFQGPHLDFCTILTEDLVATNHSDISSLLSQAGKQWLGGDCMDHADVARQTLADCVIDHLLPIAQLARMCGLSTPACDSLLSNASMTLSIDLSRHARDIAYLMQMHETTEDLIEYFNG